jgi:hypothetical protein
VIVVTTHTMVISGEEIDLLFRAARAVAGGDPRPLLFATTAAAAMIGADIPLDHPTALAVLGEELSRVAAEFAEMLTATQNTPAA